MSRERLDVLMFSKKLTESRERARNAITGGMVYVDGKCETKPGVRVSADAAVEIRGETDKYVSRGGIKLEHALRVFDVDPTGKICLDCGASTGGFTDCLLQNGARLVYALDSGRGQLNEKIRTDTRVISMERTNIRHVKNSSFPEPPELAVIDVSFISLTLVFPAVSDIVTESGEIICLIKPQFEAGRGSVGKKGVVRDFKVHNSVLDKVITEAQSLGLRVKGITHSPIRGGDGNIEYLGCFAKNGAAVDVDVPGVVKQARENFK